MPICTSGTQCPLYSAASLAPHANPPRHIILTPGRPVMFREPHFIRSSMQAGTTPIFKVFGMTGPSTNWESNPQNLLVGARFPLSSFYNQQALLRAYSSPGGSIRSPHPRSPRGFYSRLVYLKKIYLFTENIAALLWNTCCFVPIQFFSLPPPLLRYNRWKQKA